MEILVYMYVVLISSVHFHSVQAGSLGNETDRLALLRFKESIMGDPLRTLNSWNNSIPHCSWFGVTCNIRHRRVSYLILEGQELSGTISPHIGNLSFLKFLDLQNNSFNGEIPEQVGKLFRLQQLYLGNNTLGGEILVNLTSCSNLETLNLQANSIIGKIPPQLGSLVKMQSLALGINSLTGTIPLSLGNLTSLQEFSVADNKLVGEIPGELSRLENLILFYVALNNLSGVIPPFLVNISSMEELSFGGNKFHGGLPDKGFNLPNLILAQFGGNQLSEYGLGAPASKEADIYSYGILLLEMFSGRRPTDDAFTDGLNLVDLIKEALPERVMQVADPVLLIRDVHEIEGASSLVLVARDEEEGRMEIEPAGANIKMRPHEASCLMSVLEIGVSCSEESPSQRANLGDVLRKLHKVKDAFMNAQLNEDRRRRRQPREYYYH